MSNLNEIRLRQSPPITGIIDINVTDTDTLDNVKFDFEDEVPIRSGADGHPIHATRLGGAFNRIYPGVLEDIEGGDGKLVISAPVVSGTDKIFGTNYENGYTNITYQGWLDFTQTNDTAAKFYGQVFANGNQTQTTLILRSNVRTSRWIGSLNLFDTDYGSGLTLRTFNLPTTLETLGIYNNTTLLVVCENADLIVPASIACYEGGTITFNGPFPASVVNAILIALDTGGTTFCNIIIGGTSAAPTGAGLVALASLMATNTVTTN